MRRKALRTEFAWIITHIQVSIFKKAIEQSRFGITETALLFIKKRNKIAYTKWLKRHHF